MNTEKLTFEVNMKLVSQVQDLQIELKQRDETIKQLKEALKELIPIAQWGYDLLVPFDKERMGKTWPSNIDNANKLLTE